MSTKQRGPYKSRSLPPKTTPNTNDLMSKGKAISFITEKVLDNQREWRNVRDKVGKRVSYAIDNGRLHTVNGQIVFCELIVWAQTIDEWRRKLTSFPRVINLNLSEHASGTDEISGVRLPATIEDCHRLLEELQPRFLSRGSSYNSKLLNR